MTARSVQSLSEKYWLQGKKDLREADKSISRNKLEVGFLLIQQGTLNLLNAVCHSAGYFQNPSYNLTEMLNVCKRIHEDFGVLLKYCEEIDDVYSFRLFADHHKGGRKPNKEKGKQLLQSANELFQQTQILIRKHELFSI